MTSTSTSGRLRPLDLHRHDDPPGDDRPLLPAGEAAAGGAGTALPVGAGRLWREGGKVLYRAPGSGNAEAAEAVAVRVLWARPLSGRGGAVSFMLAGKKREAGYLPSLDLLDSASRQVAEEELAASMVLPRIERIRSVRPRFGNYYFDVETDRGGRRFLLSSPEVNSLRPRPDAVVLKDVSGNTYEIPSVAGLDPASRHELDRVL